MNDALPVEINWASLPSRRELHQQLDRLPLQADTKVLMGKLLGTTANVAGRIIEIGRSLLTFILDLVKRFPATSFGAIVGLTVTVLVGSIPFIGAILAPLIGPLLTAFMITNGALTDMRNGKIEKQIELFGAKLEQAIAHA